MKTFKQLISESSEKIKQLASSKADHKYAKDRGYDLSGEGRMEGHTRYRYQGKTLEKGKHAYHGHLEFKHSHQTHKHHDIKTKFTKLTPEGAASLRREIVDSGKHVSVKDAVKHLDDLYKYHEDED